MGREGIIELKREDVEAISVGHAGIDVPAKPKRAKKKASAKASGRKSLRAPATEGKTRQRRVFSPDYKLAILAEYDRCSEPGQRGALLRREGLYSSIVTDWRRQHRKGHLVGTPGRSQGGRGGHSKAEVERMRQRIRDLEDQIAKQNTIIEVQGKVQELLEQLSKSEDNDQL